MKRIHDSGDSPGNREYSELSAGAGRIGDETKTVRLGGAGKFVVDGAGLDDGALILAVEFENAIHAREDEHHAAGACERAAGKSRAGAATGDGEMAFCGEFYDAGDLVRCCRKNDDVGAAFFRWSEFRRRGRRSSGRDHAPSHHSENSETRATLSYAGNTTVC